MLTRQHRLIVSSRSRQLLFLMLLASIILLLGNSVIIPDIMEARNLVTAREMVTGNHWFIPYMNEALRLEKPPLPTWISALTQLTIGESWWAMRLAPGVMGMLLLYWFFRTVEEIVCLSKKRGLTLDSAAFLLPLVSSLVLLTCYNFILTSKTVTWDIYCHSFQMGGIYHLLLLLTSGKQRWRDALLSGLLTGLGIMSKGPVSPFALLLPFILMIVLIRGRLDIQMPSMKKIVSLIVLSLLVGGWWYLLVYLFQMDHASSVISQETEAWINHNTRPWYYYWSFFTETGYWLPLCVASLLAPFLMKGFRQWSEHNPGFMMGLLWTLAAVVLLSLMPEKKNRYLFPVLMPASLMIGTLLVHYISLGKRWANHVILASILIFTLAASMGMPLLRGLLVNERYSVPETMDIPTYWADGEEVRIEIVYDIHHTMKVVDLSDEVAVSELPRPCRILVSANLDKDALDLGRIPNLEFAGTFNSNRHASISKRHKPKLIYDLYILNQ